MGAERAKHILFVLEYFPPHVGGVETLFANLTAALARDGHKVTVLTTWLPGTEHQEVRNGVEIVRVTTPPFARRYWFTFLAIPAAVRLAREADLIHTTTYNAALPAWCAARLTGKTAVLTVHEVFGDQWMRLPGMNRAAGFLFRLLETGVLHLPFAHYLCDSDFTRKRLQRFIGVGGERASVAYPAVDYDFWDRGKITLRPLKEALHLAPDSFVYLYFGRPGVSKGLEYLLPAAVLLRERLPASRLVMILAKDPAGPYQRIRREIGRLRLDDHVVLLDPVPRAELPGYLLAADCIVAPSLSEGFGYSAVEAATLGCRVVATSGHSVEEVVGESVVLVPQRNPAALADALFRVARGERALASPVRRYDAPSHIAAVKHVYEQMRWRKRRIGVKPPAPIGS